MGDINRQHTQRPALHQALLPALEEFCEGDRWARVVKRRCGEEEAAQELDLEGAAGPVGRGGEDFMAPPCVVFLHGCHGDQGATCLEGIGIGWGVKADTGDLLLQ